ncbi:MAG: hypothetical protein ACRCTQ_00855 [Brevinemataceae bacterium]
MNINFQKYRPLTFADHTTVSRRLKKQSIPHNPQTQPAIIPLTQSEQEGLLSRLAQKIKEFQNSTSLYQQHIEHQIKEPASSKKDIPQFVSDKKEAVIFQNQRSVLTHSITNKNVKPSFISSSFRNL